MVAIRASRGHTEAMLLLVVACLLHPMAAAAGQGVTTRSDVQRWATSSVKRAARAAKQPRWWPSAAVRHQAGGRRQLAATAATPHTSVVPALSSARRRLADRPSPDPADSESGKRADTIYTCFAPSTSKRQAA